MWKRLPIIRHVRYFWLAYWFWGWWYAVGRHYWLIPNDADLRYLELVWKGKA